MGGSQEDGRRAGTEAVPQICAFGEAARVGAAQAAEARSRMSALRAHAVERLSAAIPGFTVIGGGAAHILSLSLPGYRSEVLMSWLDGQGICVSRSSACKRGARSHVLGSMGVEPRVIDGAIRVGLSRYTTAEEIDAFCDVLIAAAGQLAHN